MKVVTHNGSFHADDVFAFATLSLAFGQQIELVRTRDPEIIPSSDIVFDVGRTYDPAQKRFDHHQEGGAGKRENGIPYASFGLIWKEYGQKICSKMEADLIDDKLVQVIDSNDNGFELFRGLVNNVENYGLATAVSAFNKTSLEDNRTDDEGFLQAAELAKTILSREIANAKEYVAALDILDSAYKRSSDKAMIVIDQDIGKRNIHKIMDKYPDTLYIVKPHRNVWAVGVLLKETTSFEARKPLPKEWAGKVGEELQKITGVKDAIFCHNGRFVANAISKEGALALAKLALEG